MDLTKRQIDILEGVCQTYINKAFPISSQFLKEKCNFPFSSATIGGEFSQLEKQNYLNHPYISSGKVPTDKGYRFFVDRILERINKKKFEIFENEVINELFSELNKFENFLRIYHQITKTLSSLSSDLVLAYLPEQDFLLKEGWEMLIKEPEFQNAEYLKEFSKAIEDFEKNINKLDLKMGEVEVYIGRENPFKGRKMSIIVSGFSFPKENRSIIAILGPKRMDFKKNINLINCLISQVENFIEI